jgi:hypothetical protein
VDPVQAICGFAAVSTYGFSSSEAQRGNIIKDGEDEDASAREPRNPNPRVTEDAW